jgi:tripartite ATP-independent transporter DctP family solute receptor
MQYSKSLTYVLGAALLCSTALLPNEAASQSAKHIRLGFVISKDSPLGAFATTTADLVRQRTNGSLVIDLFEKGQLGGETEMLTSVRQGALDMTLTGSPIVAQIEGSFGVTELPFIWKDAETMFNVLNGPIGQRLLGLLDAKGLKGIAFGDSGPRSLLTRVKPINGIDDVQGLKVRVVENKLYVASWRNFGASPVPMAWPEVYTGLQQGTIDAVDSTPWGTRDAKHFEVAKSIALTNHVYTAYLLVMNLEKWNELSPDHQKILTEAALEGQKANRDLIGKENESSVEMMKKAGLTVTYPDRGQFVAKIGPVYDQFAKAINPKLLEDVQKANE